jgi:hypothetical protein
MQNPIIKVSTCIDWNKELVILLHGHHRKVTIYAEQHEMLEDGQDKDEIGGQSKE